MSLLAVNHHYYREAAPPSGIYPVSRARLAAEVEQLRAARSPIDQAGLLKALADPDAPSADSFMITFDDGLKEQMAALRDLESWGVGAVFFVPTEPLASKTVLDVHKLHLIRAARSDEKLLADLAKVFPRALAGIDLAAAAGQYRYDGRAAQQVKFLLNFVLAPEERRDWIDRVFASAVGNEAEVSAGFYMDHEDVRLLGRKGMLGTHAHRHLPLARLGREEVIRDVGRSMEILAEMGGAAIAGISYPYGGPDAVSDLVVETCAGLDLAFGFTMQRGINDAGDLRAPLRLKRIDCNDVMDYL